ncbi:MAG TPA: hypothetical protein VGJ51_08700 [Candidatus Angelobacter sp.]
MLNRFAVFLFGASLLSTTMMAQSGQPQTPPASKNPPPAQANQPSPQQQQQDSTTGLAADPAKGALQPKQEPDHWKKIKVVPNKPKAIPAGTLDKGTPA